MLMPKKVKVSQAAARPHDGQSLARLVALVRRLRFEGDGMRMGDQPADRSGAYCDDPFHQARRQGVDSACFPDKPITKKPPETRMGKGKGAPEAWVAVVRPGKMLFEMEGVSLEVATEAMRLAAMKLSVPTKFVIARMHERVEGARERQR